MDSASAFESFKQDLDIDHESLGYIRVSATEGLPTVGGGTDNQDAYEQQELVLFR